MQRLCPWCCKVHDSDDHDEGWYFACCGHTRLVWERDDKGELELLPVNEDLESD